MAPPPRPTHQISFPERTSLLAVLVGRDCTIVSIDLSPNLELELETNFFPDMRREFAARADTFLLEGEELPDEDPEDEPFMTSVYQQIILERYLPQRLHLESTEPGQYIIDGEPGSLWLDVVDGEITKRVELMNGVMRVRVY